MNTKLLATTAIAATLMTGMAFAQSTPDAKGMVGASTTSESNDTTTTNNASQSTDSMASHEYASDDEKSMYDTMGDTMSGFFTDDSMTTMKSDDEIKATFAAQGADTQAQMKAACDRVQGSRGSYGTITIGLCEKIGAL